MESMIMTFSFAAAITIAEGVVRFYSRSIDEALVRVEEHPALAPESSRLI
jgi:hypothetical protein